MWLFKLMFTSQHIGYHKTRYCSRSGKALGDAFYGDKMKPKKRLKKKLACANCLKRKLSEMMVPAKEHEILKRIWPRLLQRKFLKRIRSEKTDPVKDSSLKRSYEVSWCFRMIALNQSTYVPERNNMKFLKKLWKVIKSYENLSKVSN